MSLTADFQNRRRTKKIKIIFLILIILNCITIFYFSNQVAQTSSTSSGRVVNFIMKILPQFNSIEEQKKEYIANEILQPIVRKLAHFSIYTLLGFLTMNYAIADEKIEKQLLKLCTQQLYISKYKKVLYSQLFGTLYAITDEIHQLFIPGRSCEFRDVCIDSLGVLTGIIVALAILKIYIKIKNKLSKERTSKN